MKLSEFINKDSIFLDVRAESQKNVFKILGNIFSVYGSDGTLLAAFDSKEAAIAAIMQSGLRYISLH